MFQIKRVCPGQISLQFYRHFAQKKDITKPKIYGRKIYFWIYRTEKRSAILLTSNGMADFFFLP